MPLLALGIKRPFHGVIQEKVSIRAFWYWGTKSYLSCQVGWEEDVWMRLPEMSGLTCYRRRCRGGTATTHSGTATYIRARTNGVARSWDSMSAPEDAADGFLPFATAWPGLSLSHDIKIETIESIGRYDSHHLKILHLPHPKQNRFFSQVFPHFTPAWGCWIKVSWVTMRWLEISSKITP